MWRGKVLDITSSDQLAAWSGPGDQTLMNRAGQHRHGEPFKHEEDLRVP